MEMGQQYCLPVKSLEKCFAPPNQTELYQGQLKERRQKAFETLFEVDQAFRMLTSLAYPNAPSEERETLGKLKMCSLMHWLTRICNCASNKLKQS